LSVGPPYLIRRFARFGLHERGTFALQWVIGGDDGDIPEVWLSGLLCAQGSSTGTKKERQVRFRTRQQPRGVIPRKHQVRLTLMLMGLAAVLIGSRLFGKPEFWARMFPDEAVASVENSAVNVVSRTVFRPELTSEPVAIPLAAELQDVIRDDVMGVRAEEWKAWAFSLRLAEDLVEQSRAGEVLRLPSAKYALLMDAPENCRGRAWQITGTLRRMTRERVMNRNLGEMTVIDAWLTIPETAWYMSCRGLPMMTFLCSRISERTLRKSV
jgi:hypothetical protein